MPELLLHSGEIATKEDYLSSDVVKQMLQDAEKKGSTATPDLATVVQAAKPEDLLALEPVKKAVADAKEGLTTKEAVIQALSADDVTELPVVKQMIEDAGKTPEAVVQFAKLFGMALGADGKPIVAAKVEPQKSFLELRAEERRIPGLG